MACHYSPLKKEILKVGGLHDDVLVLGVLVSLSQLVLLHEGLVVCTVLAMVDTCVAGGVQGGEGYVLALGGRIKLDRDRYHPIADGAFLNSSWWHYRAPCPKPESGG